MLACNQGGDMDQHQHGERRGSMSTFVTQEGSTQGPFSTPALSISIDECDDDPTASSTTPLSVDDCISSQSPSSSLEAYRSFDTVVGAIEDVAVGKEFQALQSFYLSKYWKEFEGDENSESTHEQFMIFQNYSKEMAHLIETHVKRQLGSEFSVSNFIERWYGTLDEQQQQQLLGQAGGNSSTSRDLMMSEDCSPDGNAERHPQSFNMTCEIETLLFPLTDFCKFKELMIDYRKMLEGKTPTLIKG